MAPYVIVGGGISGVSCIEYMLNAVDDDDDLEIVMISASPVVKSATNVENITRNLQHFQVEESEFAEKFKDKSQKVKLVQDEALNVKSNEKILVTKSGLEIPYKKLCLCHGAKPKLIHRDQEHVIGIRDTESVAELQRRVKKCRRIAVVGNGGIATELVHELKNVQIVWIIKDDSVSAAFVDEGAGKFFLDSITDAKDKKDEQPTLKRAKFTMTKGNDVKVSGEYSVGGAALGPDWQSELEISGISQGKDLRIEFETEVMNISKCEENEDFDVKIELKNGKKIECDLVISATGVIPNGESVLIDDSPPMNLTEEKAIKVNSRMQVKGYEDKDIFACGDCCQPEWPQDHSDLWFQMRLWTQARQMGMYAARCMLKNGPWNDLEDSPDFCFEMFSHVTRFFGFKVVLLGLFNGQGLDGNYEALMRITEGVEYVKAVVKDGKVMGAVLVGETDLEETFENLILNGIDVTSYGEDLLNPNIDIEDYFD